LVLVDTNSEEIINLQVSEELVVEKEGYGVLDL
jgi:hypothetical protein